MKSITPPKTVNQLVHRLDEATIIIDNALAVIAELDIAHYTGWKCDVKLSEHLTATKASLRKANEIVSSEAAEQYRILIRKMNGNRMNPKARAYTEGLQKASN